MTNKNNEAYKTIKEVAEILNLFNPKTGKVSTHTLRFWESEFKQIKPKVFAGNRRYYDIKTIKTLKKIKFLLKDKGMTINGVKNVLKSNINTLDDYDLYSLKADYHKKNIKDKSKIILDKIKKIKKYGKKITH